MHKLHNLLFCVFMLGLLTGSLAGGIGTIAALNYACQHLKQ